MNVYLNSITGIADAIVAMYMSKRTWTRELEEDIRSTCAKVFNVNGQWRDVFLRDDEIKICDWLSKLTRWGIKHPTLLRFIDVSVTVEGLHRAGQDDWDSHAKRFDNRIVRSSTRLATFNYEMSDYYKNKIIPTDLALQRLEINIPEQITIGGVHYVKTINGYIRSDLQDDKDVKRGLYMLSIPSNFIFKINITEYAHVYKERNIFGTANPEVKECCEKITDEIESWFPQFNRSLYKAIIN